MWFMSLKQVDRGNYTVGTAGGVLYSTVRVYTVLNHLSCTTVKPLYCCVCVIPVIRYVRTRRTVRYYTVLYSVYSTVHAVE